METGRARTRVHAPTTVLALAAVLAAVGLLLLPDFDVPGLELDEGSLLVYPDRILEGDLPHRDFTTLYGPGGFWLLAGVYEATDPSLDVERVVGLVYRLLIVGAVFGLALPGGVAIASASGLLAGVMLLTTGVSAGVALGSIAFGLVGLALALGATRNSRHGGRLALAAGASLGVAVLFRFDFAPALLLGVLPAAVAMPRAERKQLALGFLGMAALYIPHIAVSWESLGQVWGDLTGAMAGRQLPVPALSTSTGQLLAAQGICIALMLVLGTLARTRLPNRDAGLVLLSGGLFAAAMQPYAFFRLDLGHVVSVALIPIGLLPLLVATAADAIRGGTPRGFAAALGIGIATLAGLVLAPGALRGPLRDHAERLVGFADQPPATEVSRGERSFILAPAAEPDAVDATLLDAERISEPGDRLFVGTGDLRRTSYNDTFLYYLLDELEPASFYIEFFPGGANRADSGLAADIRSADIIVLNRRWDAWDEPNDSRDFGPETPNRVIDQLFCLRSRHGPYLLYRRCPAASATF
jgi:hypothetical protein